MFLDKYEASRQREKKHEEKLAKAFKVTTFVSLGALSVGLAMMAKADHHTYNAAYTVVTALSFIGGTMGSIIGASGLMTYGEKEFDKGVKNLIEKSVDNINSLREKFTGNDKEQTNNLKLK